MTQPWCRVSTYHRDGTIEATWLLRGCGDPGLETVDQIARWGLGAGRRGLELRLSEIDVRLSRLLDLCGLAADFVASGAVSVQRGGQPERREDMLDVEE